MDEILYTPQLEVTEVIQREMKAEEPASSSIHHLPQQNVLLNPSSGVQVAIKQT